MGRPGRRAGTHAELVHAPVTQSRRFHEGEFPFCPRPVTLKEHGRPLVAGLITAPASPPIGTPRPPDFPCTALTGTLKGTPRPQPQHTNPLGVSPFHEFAAAGKRREGVGEERRGEGGSRAARRRQCAKTVDCPCSCGAGPVTVEEAGAVRDGREAGAEEGAGRRRVRLHRATVFVGLTTTTPTPRR
jgi:hypothetical protein